MIAQTRARALTSTMPADQLPPVVQFVRPVAKLVNAFKTMSVEIRFRK